MKIYFHKILGLTVIQSHRRALGVRRVDIMRRASCRCRKLSVIFADELVQVYVCHCLEHQLTGNAFDIRQVSPMDRCQSKVRNRSSSVPATLVDGRDTDRCYDPGEDSPKGCLRPSGRAAARYLSRDPSALAGRETGFRNSSGRGDELAHGAPGGNGARDRPEIRKIYVRDFVHQFTEGTELQPSLGSLCGRLILLLEPRLVRHR